MRARQGRHAAALDDLRELGRRHLSLDGRNPALFAWRSDAALILLEHGEEDEARKLASEEVKLARAWGAPRALGKALRAAGLAAGGDRGLSLLREATEVLEDPQARLEHAYALTELGAALRRRNRRSDARDPLRRGLDLAHLVRRDRARGAGPRGAGCDRDPAARHRALGRRRSDPVGAAGRRDGRARA